MAVLATSCSEACGTTTKEVEQLNPEVRASRTPPAQEDWMVRVPIGKSTNCEKALTKTKRTDPSVERYAVTPGYFSVMRIPLIRGRLIADSDRLDTEKVMVIGQHTADDQPAGRMAGVVRRLEIGVVHDRNQIRGHLLDRRHGYLG